MNVTCDVRAAKRNLFRANSFAFVCDVFVNFINVSFENNMFGNIGMSSTQSSKNVKKIIRHPSKLTSTPFYCIYHQGCQAQMDKKAKLHIKI